MPSDKRARQRANKQTKEQAEKKKARRRSLLIRGAIVVVVAAAIGGIAYAVTGHGSPKSASATTTTSASSSTTTTSGSTTTTAASSSAQATANAAAVAAGCPSNPSATANTLKWGSAPAMTIDKTKTYTATVTTDVGTFTVQLDPQTAPITTNNFVFLANQGFYKCNTFWRVIPGFMNQTGDPTGTGTGGPGYTIADEYPKKAADSSKQYAIGAVVMANTGQPHSGGSQFFVVTGAEGQSLPNSYSTFGQVTSGMSVVDKINQDGNSSASANGTPPKVIHRMLSVKISES